MKSHWPMRLARAQFGRLIETIAKKGPQTVTRHGKSVAIVLSVAEYDRLKRISDFKEFLRSAPALHELDLTRIKDTGRDIDL